MHKLLYKVGITAAFASLLILAPKAHAATLSVVAGADGIGANGQCQLSEAIQNINDQIQTYADCAAGDSANDTINLPSGTITLTADLPQITRSIKIVGTGMSTSIIDGDSGQYRPIDISGALLTGELSKFKVYNFKTAGIATDIKDTILDQIEIEAPNNSSGMGEIRALFLDSTFGQNSTLTASNIYIHNISGSYGSMHGFVVSKVNGGTFDTNIHNVTVADIHNNLNNGALNTFIFAVGPYHGFGGAGSITTNTYNVTIHDVTSPSGVSGFGTVAFGGGGTADVQGTFRNVTVTGVKGGMSPFGTSSIGFLSAAGGMQNGDVGTSNITAQNVILADNGTNGVPSSCAALDVSPLFNMQGSGTATITSLGHNISDDATCSSFNQPGDQQNVSNLVSTLGPLQNNGGLTPTRALLAGSPAIGAGTYVLGISTDQRGVARPTSNPDIGAYQTAQSANTDTPGSQTGQPLLPDTGDNEYGYLFIALGLVAISCAAIFRSVCYTVT